MKRVLVAVLAVALGEGASYAWRPLSHSEVERPEIFAAPKVSIFIEEESVILGQRVSSRVVIENPGSREMVTILRVLDDLTLGTTLRIAGGARKLHPYVEMSNCTSHSVGALDPGERMSRDALLSYWIQDAGSYSLYVNYPWRGPWSPNEDPALRFLRADVLFSVTEPTGVDAQAMQFVDRETALLGGLEHYGVVGKMAALQDDGLEFMLQDAAVNDLRRRFLTIFGASSYAQDVLIALGRSLRREGKRSEAHAAFRQYLEKYPDSWHADEVLLAIAEDEINLGLTTQAETTMRDLLKLGVVDSWIVGRLDKITPAVSLEAGTVQKEVR